MKRRNAVHLVVWSFLAAAGCSSTSAPALPACGPALASQVALSVGGDTTLDPAADSGCVTFAANLSAIDSAEYLLVPQSAAGTFGESSPFLLRTTTLTAAAPGSGPVRRVPAPPGAQWPGRRRGAGAVGGRAVTNHGDAAASGPAQPG